MRAVLEELRAGKATVEETDKLVAEDPYVKEITSDIQSTNEEATVLRNEMQAMIPEYQKQQAAVARLEGALDKADDTERFELSQKVRDARDRLDRMERDYREKGREYKRLEADWKRQTRGLREAQAQARARVDAAKADAARFQQEARLSRQEFRDTLVEEAKKVGIGPDDPAFSFLHESFRARLSAHMRALQARGVTEGIDLPRAVRVLMKEYVGARPKEFAAASADKVRTATPTKPTAPAPPEKPGTKKDGEMSAAEWKARAKQLMP